MSDRSATKPEVGVADPRDILMRAQRAAAMPLRNLQQLHGGASSLTYLATTATGDKVVVKVAPPGLEPVRNRDVLRQARALTALADVAHLSVPRVLGTDPGIPPEVPPLFVMSHAPGESYEPRHGVADRRPSGGEVRRRAAAAASMLAALHTVDPACLELAEPVTTPGDEVAKWRKALDTCELTPIADAAAVTCHERLLAAVPAPLRPAILHGDWRLGNMQCVGDEVTAVIDWEIWSIGDPRLDLAWLRLMSDPDHPSATAADAPTLEPDELLTEYETASGAPVPDLAWFDALARYKQAAASALLVKNAERRGQVTERVERMRRGIPLLLSAAITRLPY
ncbi:phosphotransferase family protein [Nocardia sp. XZ_19_231]|uniref:phosphotransferase family protein n=1 Tax=Nocardia sp. XZ_19_231 TaxID=2769252 RepID=UPI00188F290D|nr:phosphotransferase family protein [Nocardia sp. XZ_19_231]